MRVNKVRYEKLKTLLKVNGKLKLYMTKFRLKLKLEDNKQARSQKEILTEAVWIGYQFGRLSAEDAGTSEF